jgi:NADH-quinone oxidoreductase subunit J
MLQTLAFYLFSIVMLASAVMVIGARNPVHSVLFLILAFFNAAGLFVLLGAEFLAMILLVVYVGAVAVLFLFVVMMLDIDFAALRQGVMVYLPLGAVIGFLLLLELGFVLFSWQFGASLSGAIAHATPEGVSNTQAMGRILYTGYIFYFQTSGLVLLVAMIGAIVLTLRHKEGVKRQSIAAQVARGPATGLEMVKVASGQFVLPDKGKKSSGSGGKRVTETVD